VPIKLYATKTNEVVWQNPKPSSTWFCRPILFEFAKETVESTNRIVGEINDEIKALVPSKCQKNEMSIVVSHKLAMTMIDGKVCNSVAGNRAAMNCYICDAKPSEMNDFSKIDKQTLRKTAWSSACQHCMLESDLWNFC
jgi:hypothetical protein